MRKTGTILMTLGAALILSALLLIVYNNIVEQRAAESAESLLPTLHAMIEERLSARAEETSPPLPEETEMPDVSPAPTPDTAAPTPSKEPSAVINGRAYLGYITIPSLELELPIMAECDESKLRLAPCRQFGTVEGGDLVIAGHNYKRHFGRLTEMKVTDLLLFTDMDGSTWVYEVGAIEMLRSDQVSEMKSSDWELTLYTCTLWSDDRLTLRCRLVETILA